MFERFISHFKKQESVPEPLIPNFVENSETQDLVSKCAEAWINWYAFTHDGQPNEAKKYDKEVEQLIKEYKEVLTDYLQPYMDLTEEKRWGFAIGNESDRRRVAWLLLANNKKEIA